MELYQNKKLLNDKERNIKVQPTYWKKIYLRYASHKVGGVVQVVGHIPSMQEVMSSTMRITKKSSHLIRESFGKHLVGRLLG
jgi:hypothetical protein